MPADARILTSLGIETDESSLTGESFPVRKSAGKIAETTGLADRNNMVFSGTVVTRGEGRAVIVATGVQAEIGKIGKIVKEARDPRTPLQLEMKQLAKFLVWVALFFSVLVPVLGILRGEDYRQMILTGLSLAFATIPEELPIIITMVLALGALVLSRKHAMVKKLRAAETLGSVTVIATDKTGTITENRMRLESMYLDGKIVPAVDIGRHDPAILDISLLASGLVRDEDGGGISFNPMANALTQVGPRETHRRTGEELAAPGRGDVRQRPQDGDLRLRVPGAGTDVLLGSAGGAPGPLHLPAGTGKGSAHDGRPQDGDNPEGGGYGQVWSARDRLRLP